jgi:hypothetical protein
LYFSSKAKGFVEAVAVRRCVRRVQAQAGSPEAGRSWLRTAKISSSYTPQNSRKRPSQYRSRQRRRIL